MRHQCIEHNQVGNKGGYGKGTYNGKRMLLHRIVYCFNYNVSPELIGDLVIRHKCDNTKCINPNHLEIGSQLDNIQDRVVRGRSNKPTGTQNPRAVLTPDDVSYILAHYIPRDPVFGNVGLGRKFNVSHQTIRAVLQGKSWV